MLRNIFFVLCSMFLLINMSASQMQVVRNIVNSSTMGPSVFDEATKRIYYFDVAEDGGYHLYWVSYLDAQSTDAVMACNLTELYGEKGTSVSELKNQLGEFQVAFGGNGEIFMAVTVQGSVKMNSVIEYKSDGDACNALYTGTFRNINNGAWIYSDNHNGVVYLSVTVLKGGNDAYAISTYDISSGAVTLVHEMMWSDFSGFIGFAALEGLNHAYFLNENFVGLHEIWAVNPSNATKIGETTSTRTLVRFVSDSQRNMLCFQGSSDLSFFTFSSPTEYDEEVITASFITDPGLYPAQFLKAGLFLYFDDSSNIVLRNTTASGYPEVMAFSATSGTTLFIAEESEFLVAKYQSSNYIAFSLLTGSTTTVNLPSGYTGSLLGVNDKKGQVLATLVSGATRNLFIFPIDQSNYTALNVSINSVSDAKLVDEKLSIFVFRDNSKISAISYEDCIGDGYYGDNCLLECSCSEAGTVNCTDGSMGDGKCNCKEGYMGNNCSQCEDGYYGSVEGEQLYCISCPDCVHGSCSDGTSGNGTCLCTGNWNGTLCDSCLEPYIGEKCEDLPTSTSEETSSSDSTSEQSTNTVTSEQPTDQLTTTASSSTVLPLLLTMYAVITLSL
eukprot:TRINITY_DN2116_c0_g1_i1.p1 TRINITY_DN2116_c0_g1~~TRINITY_DN2116_c0_g1_i1.p1  ORF type:complete len:614 (-),score=104.53 TRINITY_DN2116_c0_g1_i1:1169-3010(-)